MPSAPSVTNHSVMIGPKNLPTVAVPCRWIRNRTVRITSVIGITKCPSCGAAISRPSTAESTEMAGVMTASP
ncbi:hypothetical protein D3C87_1284760 [compost metagenome]